MRILSKEGIFNTMEDPGSADLRVLKRTGRVCLGQRSSGLAAARLAPQPTFLHQHGTKSRVFVAVAC